MSERPEVPIAVAMPVLPRRTLTPQQGGPVAYQVPGIRFVPGVSMYEHAMNSVADQSVYPAGGRHAATDFRGVNDIPIHGAGPTRKRALRLALGHLKARYVEDQWTEHPYGTFVSFIDDDDLWYPHHLETHYRLLTEGDGGDVAYSYFDGNSMPGWETTHKGKVWDPAEPHHTTMALTVRASFAVAVMGAFDVDPMHPDWSGEDWKFILALNDLGARFVGTGDVTWHYRVHNGNTSGLPTKGDATL